MSLCKRKGIFYYWYRGEDGRRKKISTHTSRKSEALEFIRRMHERPVVQTMSLGQFIPQFLKYADATFSTGWRTVYHLALGHLRELCGNMPLNHITPLHADQYKLKRLESVSGSTVNHELEAIRAAFYTAVRWQMMQKNPFANVKKVVVPERRVDYFSMEEFQRLVEASGEQWYKDILVCALHTGLRRSEIVNIKWQNVDLEQRTILVVSDATFKTKTRRLRILPMSKEVEQIIQRQPRCSEYVFTYRGRSIKPGHLTLKTQRLRNELGLRKELNIQALRHSYASWMVRKGVSIYHVSKLLGHSSVTTTQKHYASLETSELHGIIEKVFDQPARAAATADQVALQAAPVLPLSTNPAALRGAGD